MGLQVLDYGCLRLKQKKPIFLPVTAARLLTERPIPALADLVVFSGRRMDRCKILLWDRGVFVLYYKRLEPGRFQRPRLATGASSVQLDATALTILLDGIDLRGVRRPDWWRPAA